MTRTKARISLCNPCPRKVPLCGRHVYRTEMLGNCGTFKMGRIISQLRDGTGAIRRWQNNETDVVPTINVPPMFLLGSTFLGASQITFIIVSVSSTTVIAFLVISHDFMYIIWPLKGDNFEGTHTVYPGNSMKYGHNFGFTQNSHSYQFYHFRNDKYRRMNGPFQIGTNIDIWTRVCEAISSSWTRAAIE